MSSLIAPGAVVGWDWGNELVIHHLLTQRIFCAHTGSWHLSVHLGKGDPKCIPRSPGHAVAWWGERVVMGTGQFHCSERFSISTSLSLRTLQPSFDLRERSVLVHSSLHQWGEETHKQLCASDRGTF